MRVVATTVPSWGHLVPMLGTLCALRDLGHEVTVATHAEFHAQVSRWGFTAADAGLSEAQMLAERSRRWPESLSQPPAVWAPRMFTEIAAPAMRADLDRVIGDALPGLLICEEGEYGGPSYAAAHGIGWISHGWGSPPIARDHARPPAVRVDPCPRSLQPTPPDAVQAWAIRLSPPRLTERDPAMIAWLRSRDRPVAYVSFGSVPLYAPTPTTRTAVVDALLAHGYDVVASAPGLAAHERVYSAPFVELGDVLPLCQLVVCHGGAGTTLAALTHAVSLVLVPQGAPSQQRMAAACARRGVGTVAAADLHDLDECIEGAASSPTGAAVREVADEIASAPAPSEVAEKLAGLEDEFRTTGR